MEEGSGTPKSLLFSIKWGPHYQIYTFAQILGGLVGSALVYANYIHAIDVVEGGRHIRTLTTAGLFSTYAVCCNVSNRLPQSFWAYLHRIAARLYDERFCLFFGVFRLRCPHVYGVSFWRSFKHASTSWIVTFGFILVDSGHWYFAWNADRYSPPSSDYE